MYAASKGSTKGIQDRIAHKQSEFDSLLQLKSQSDILLRSMQELESKLGTLTGGTDAVASVLANWANVFKAINISTLRMQERSEEGGDDEMPDPLVRIATANAAQK